jgi:hypothetical protein
MRLACFVEMTSVVTTSRCHYCSKETSARFGSTYTKIGTIQAGGVTQAVKVPA